MKNKSSMAVYGWLLFVITLLAISSCGRKLQHQIETHNGNGYIQFEYLDQKHIQATAINAIWLSAGWNSPDTIVLNPEESVLITLSDDEPLEVFIGNGDVNLSFIFDPNFRVIKYEYQLTIDDTGYNIYTDDKLLGRIEYGYCPYIDTIFINDNL